MSTFKGYRDLIVYKKAFSLAMKIFNVTKAFPQDEKYSLVDQIRRSKESIKTISLTKSLMLMAKIVKFSYGLSLVLHAVTYLRKNLRSLKLM